MGRFDSPGEISHRCAVDGAGTHGAPYGIYNPETLNQTVVDMGDLVRRDRSHPSIFAWNFCESRASNPCALCASICLQHCMIWFGHDAA